MGQMFYKSLFRGWVRVTPEEAQKLRQYLESGITAMNGEKKAAYIGSRFRYEKQAAERS